jgi:poly-gamma-glutamate synthesis protein (capsule biosynthesis protein)
LAPDDLRRQARNARKAGADIVLVAAHAGTEYSSRENAEQRRLARALTSAADIDLVYMHHAHVVQPWTKINGRWVVYGLGNAVGQGSPNRPRTYEGVTARFTFSRSGSGRFAVSKAEYIPTLVTRYRPGRPARVHVVSASLPDADGAFRRRLLDARARTTAVVTRHDPPGLRRG